MLAGIQINISRIRLYGRYTIGLNNLNDIDNRDKWKSQTIHAGMGLHFLISGPDNGIGSVIIDLYNGTGRSPVQAHPGGVEQYNQHRFLFLYQYH